MNRLKTWFSENKGPSLFVAVFLLLSGAFGWFAYSSWDDYSIAFQSYSDAVAKLATMAKQNPPPTESNLTKLGKAIESEQSSLNELLLILGKYRIPVFPPLEKAKPQDAPQLFQDALRGQVTKLREEAASAGSTLPSGFYLALEEYENRLPSPDDTNQLARQLTVFNWITQRLISHSGLIIGEFSKTASSPSTAIKPDRKSAPSVSPQKSETPYEITASLKISFRCDQSSLREILNSFSQSPYFLVIDSLQFQNTVTEPPRRDSAQVTAPSSNPPQEGQPSIQRIPIVVGREQINATLRVRILEFPERLTISTPPAK